MICIPRPDWKEEEERYSYLILRVLTAQPRTGDTVLRCLAPALTLGWDRRRRCVTLTLNSVSRQVPHPIILERSVASVDRWRTRGCLHGSRAPLSSYSVLCRLVGAMWLPTEVQSEL